VMTRFRGRWWWGSVQLGYAVKPLRILSGGGAFDPSSVDLLQQARREEGAARSAAMLNFPLSMRSQAADELQLLAALPRCA
jgi:hypothetical protein